MSAIPFDPVAVKEQQRTTWNAISAGWESWHERFEAAAAPVTAQLLRLAGIRSGDRVLDLGSGIGEPALSAVRLVGPAGRVIGIDLAGEMVARARLRAGGATNVSFIEGDFEHVDLPDASFDVALSRWGLMFAVDRPGLLGALRRRLVPGGVLAAAVWASAEANPLMSLGYRVLTEGLDLPAPPPGTPGPFSMSDPGAVAAELAAAGLVDVSVAPYPVAMRFASAAEYVEFTRAVTPPAVREMVRARLGPAGERAGWARVGAAAAGYAAPGGGVLLPGLALCLRAVVPPAAGAARRADSPQVAAGA
jgi:SAM-dependent methyltransferase